MEASFSRRLKFDSRTTIGQIIRLPFRLIPREAVVPVLTGPMAGLRWVVGSAPHGAWLGTLERSKLTHFVQSLEARSIVWDLGANVGLYAVASARAVGSEGHVYAFEPYERNLGYLERHRDLNRIQNLTVVPRAVHDRVGTARMVCGESPSEFHMSSEGSIEVEAVTLDSWYERSGSRSPDVLKIDVEGAEDAVLRGGANVLTRFRPVIYLSLHGERQRQECRALLSAWGYELTSLEKGVETERSSEWLARP